MLGLIMFMATLSTSPFDVASGARPVEITAQDQAAVDRLGDAFLDRLRSKRYLEAFTEALSSPAMRKRVADLENAAADMERSLNNYGPIVDWSKIGQQNISPNLIRVYYLVRTENLPIFFRVEYYSFGGKWQIVNINYWDNFDSVR